MVEYGKAIGSVIGATLVFDAVGRLAKKGKKVKLYEPIKKCKKR